VTALDATEPRTVIEHDLAVAVADTLLRENYGGLAQRVRRGPDGPVLDLPGVCGHVRGPGRPGLVLPLEPDGFLADLRIRRPGPPLALGDVDAAVAALADHRDRDGVIAFAAECRQALAALRLQDRERLSASGASGPGDGSRAHPGLIGTRGGPAAARLGPAGQLDYEALAARLPHPAYPTSPGRLGFSDADALRYAPEHRPHFELNWVAVPRDALARAGAGPPAWWPQPPDVGLPSSLAGTHDLLPVHPLTAQRALTGALAETGLTDPASAGSGQAGPAGPADPPGPGAPRDRAVVAPGTWLQVTPTLSTRTVALTRQPGTHLKLPLPTSTLGRLNRRSIVPGTLADGALVRAIMAAAAERDDRLSALLLADETSYAHAGHPYLGYLLRSMPEGLSRCRLVPIAALLAPADPGAGPGGRPLVIEDLAAWCHGGDLTGLFRAYLRMLFGVHVHLFVRYGIALEAHQQNATLVVPDPEDPAGDPGAPLRLLVKDFDGALLNHDRLTVALHPVLGHVLPLSAFADDRLLTRSDDALADVFITIVLHLCAGALAFGLAERRVAPLGDLLALVRDTLVEALDRYPGEPGAVLLRARLLDAGRLPGKAMVTAGTLVAKARTGARDINKFYGTTGPNYLRHPAVRGER
jgi:hypothetical protein